MRSPWSQGAVDDFITFIDALETSLWSTTEGLGALEALSTAVQALEDQAVPSTADISSQLDGKMRLLAN